MSRLLLLLALVAVAAYGVQAQADDVCSVWTSSSNGCNSCWASAGCGWCKLPSDSNGRSASSCMSGSVLGPTVGSCVSLGGQWVYISNANVCGDECQWKCDLTCNDLCTSSQDSSNRFQCSCSNIAHLLGMSIVAGALVIAFICLAVCVGIAVCCWCCLRRPRVLVSQPVMVAYAAPNAYGQQPQQQQQYSQGYPQQQYGQPLLVGQPPSHV